MEHSDLPKMAPTMTPNLGPSPTYYEEEEEEKDAIQKVSTIPEARLESAEFDERRREGEEGNQKLRRRKKRALPK